MALAFLLQYLCPDKAAGKTAGKAADKTGEHALKGRNAGWLWLSGAAFFVVCSFLTKQDGGGLALLVTCGLLAAHGVLTGKWMPLLIFGGSLIVLLFLVILPFLPYGFGYWF